MKRFTTFLVTAALCMGSAFSVQAGGHSAAITDQSYKAGKYSGSTNADVLANCPREYRGMYRGDLYCRKPQYSVMAVRHPSCPKDVWGMYRGNLYCFGRN